MCDCKQVQTKLEAAEGVIKQMGEPVYLMYQSRLPSTGFIESLSSYIIPILIGVGLVIGLGYCKPQRVEKPSVIKTEIEL